jgi:hypothetical protein
MSETAKTLQRWDCHHEYIEKVEGNEWGDWVSYDDAAKLLAEVERLREEVEYLRKAHQTVIEWANLYRDDNIRMRYEIERMKEDGR